MVEKALPIHRTGKARKALAEQFATRIMGNLRIAQCSAINTVKGGGTWVEVTAVHPDILQDVARIADTFGFVRNYEVIPGTSITVRF